MGGSQGITLTGFWYFASNSGVIVSLAFLVAIAWLCVHRRRANTALSFAKFADENKTDFFQLFSRTVVILVCAVITSAYVYGGGGLMDAVFVKIPNAYIIYVFLFMAYDAFWKVVAQFNGELH
jgi:hypothetical protein